MRFATIVAVLCVVAVAVADPSDHSPSKCCLPDDTLMAILLVRHFGQVVHEDCIYNIEGPSTLHSYAGVRKFTGKHGKFICFNSKHVIARGESEDVLNEFGSDFDYTWEVDRHWNREHAVPDGLKAVLAAADNRSSLHVVSREFGPAYNMIAKNNSQEQ